jgi:AraC family transcriptional regulator
MSEFHFNHLFKRAKGVPPSQYQIKLRMDAARRLLRETKKSVITIAMEVGYSNPSHFARLFRKETGLSPSGASGKGNSATCPRGRALSHGWARIEHRL